MIDAATTIRDQVVNDIIEQIRLAGDELLTTQCSASVNYKPDDTVVTEQDRAVGSRLAGYLLRQFPDSQVLVEDSDRPGLGQRDGKILVALDPIDGSGPYARGLAHYAISLALFDKDKPLRPLLAIVHLPALNRWYLARNTASGLRLARVYSKRFQLPAVSATPDPGMAPPWHAGKSYVWISSDSHKYLARYTGKVRALGTTATHLAMLTDLTTDPAAVLLTRYKFHDVAAGLMLAEACAMQPWDVEEGRLLRMRDLYDIKLCNRPILVGPKHVVEKLSHALGG